MLRPFDLRSYRRGVEMFRKMTRIKQQLSNEECAELLSSERRGVLAVLGDDEYPYALPINFYYSENENKIYFHSGKAGHKTDAIAGHDKASFCVYDSGYRRDGEWALNIKSVIVFGRIRPVENWSKDMIRVFCRKFTDDMDYIENEIEKFSGNTVVFELEIEHMTGKLVNEA